MENIEHGIRVDGGEGERFTLYKKVLVIFLINNAQSWDEQELFHLRNS